MRASGIGCDEDGLGYIVGRVTGAGSKSGQRAFRFSCHTCLCLQGLLGTDRHLQFVLGLVQALSAQRYHYGQKVLRAYGHQAQHRHRDCCRNRFCAFRIWHVRLTVFTACANNILQIRVLWAVCSPWSLLSVSSPRSTRCGRPMAMPATQRRFKPSRLGRTLSDASLAL